MFATIPPPPRRLLVFARLPLLGEVKSRLAESIGKEKALAVYEAMLHDALASTGQTDATTEIEVLWAPTPAANGAALRRAFGDRMPAMQTGPTLGDRLAMAFSERFFFQRSQKVIAIGVDEPTLTRETIDDAFGVLDACEWVVGPARDGGYYLIGSRGATFNADVFRDIEWGTESVLSATLARIRQWKHTVAMLPERSDVDVLDDLRRFAVENRDRPGALANLVRAWGLAA